MARPPDVETTAKTWRPNMRTLTLAVVAAVCVTSSPRAADRGALGTTDKFRVFVDKVFAEPNRYGITEDHIRQIAEAGFNVVSPRRGHDDLARVRREAQWAQRAGRMRGRWDGAW